jgi:cytochrome c oxidase assembly protein subunit 15
VTGALAIYLWRCAGRRHLTVLGFVAILLVIVQGIAGGVRVTELSLGLGVAHGVHGQMILALLAVIVTLTASSWQREPKGAADPIDRWSSLILVLLLLSQLVLGALSRHFSRDWLIFHILGAFLILVLIVLVGVRGGLPAMPQTRSRIGISLVIGASLQIALGFAALAVTGAALQGALPSAPSGVLETLVATSHQTVGALMLSLAASLLCWAFRPRA